MQAHKEKNVKDHLQFVCVELHSAPTFRSAMLRQSFALGDIKEKHLRKMSAFSRACRHSNTRELFYAVWGSAPRRKISFTEPLLYEI